jgi:nucleotide-binding universal stress UspA family protein
MTPAPFDRILVGYVATEQGADARALGVDLAALCGADLLLVSVVRGLWIEHVGEQIGPPLVHSGGRDRASAALNEAAAELAVPSGRGQVERRLEVSSSAARGLHDAAVSEQADLVVVGSSHHGPVGRVLLGSVGERLLSGAPCAVALAPRGHAVRELRDIRLIAVAFDASPEAQLALGAAHDLALRTGAALHVLMVIEPPAAIPGQFVPLPGLEPLITIERGEALQRQEQFAQNALDTALAEIGGEATVQRRVLFGTDPAGAILELVDEDVDLLLLGSRAYGPVHRALVGSVSSAVVRHARCPVLVMPRVTEPGVDSAWRGQAVS